MGFAQQIDLSRFLNRLLMRSDLGEDEQRAILDLPGHFSAVKPNRDFVAAREIVGEASLIVDGMVGSVEQARGGAWQITAIHLPGDMANLHSLLQPVASSALQALSAVTILRIPHTAIRSAIARFPALADALWRDSIADMSRISRWVLNLGRRDACARVAHMLCEVATRLGSAKGQASFSFSWPLTQFQIADATGLTPVHVNRIVARLRNEGIADVAKPQVKVLSWEALVNAAHFNDDYLDLAASTDGGWDVRNLTGRANLHALAS